MAQLFKLKVADMSLFTYTVTRAGNLNVVSSVDWAVAGSGANPANAADFVGNAVPSGTLNFAVGEATKDIVIQVVGDKNIETDEMFTVTLSNPNGATIQTGVSTGTITNDDAVQGQQPLTASTLSAPEIELFTSNLTFPPKFLIKLDETYNVSTLPALNLIGKNKAGEIIHTFGPHTITLAEATDGSAGTTGKFIFEGLATVANGTHRWSVFGQLPDQLPSPSSNIIIQGPDDIEPLISLPTTGAITSTSVTYGFSTETAEGVGFAVFTLNNVKPTDLQVEAGQNSAGAPAEFKANNGAGFAINVAGALVRTATGLNPATPYYRWYMHKDALGNRSAVLEGGSVTTDVAATFSLAQAAAPTPLIFPGAGPHNFNGLAAGAAASGRQMLWMAYGQQPTLDVTISGAVAAKVIETVGQTMSAWLATAATGTTVDVSVNNPHTDYVGGVLFRLEGATADNAASLDFNYHEIADETVTIAIAPGAIAAVIAMGQGAALTVGFSANVTKGGQVQSASAGKTIAYGVTNVVGNQTITLTGVPAGFSGILVVSYKP